MADFLIPVARAFGGTTPEQYSQEKFRPILLRVDFDPCSLRSRAGCLPSDEQTRIRHSSIELRPGRWQHKN